MKKTKEMIVDFRKGGNTPPPIYIGGAAVEAVFSFKYLGVHITDNPTWSNNTVSIVKKAHPCLYFLRGLRHAGLAISVLTSFYRCVVESVLTSTVWYGNCSAARHCSR